MLDKTTIKTREVEGEVMLQTLNRELVWLDAALSVPESGRGRSSRREPLDLIRRRQPDECLLSVGSCQIRRSLPRVFAVRRVEKTLQWRGRQSSLGEPFPKAGVATAVCWCCRFNVVGQKRAEQCKRRSPEMGRRRRRQIRSASSED